MNGIKLADLAIGIASLMPSEAAAPHACREWRHAREVWLAALSELGLSEDDARRLGSRLIAVSEKPTALQ